jgi:hypothetical protein
VVWRALAVAPLCCRLAVPEAALQQPSLLSVHLLQPAQPAVAPEQQQGSPDSQPTASQASADSAAALPAEGVTAAAVPTGTLLASVHLLVLPEPCCAEVLQLAADLAGQGSSSMCRDLAGFMMDFGLLLELHNAPGSPLGSSSSSSRQAAVAQVQQQLASLLLERDMVHCCALLGMSLPPTTDTAAAPSIGGAEQSSSVQARSTAGTSEPSAAKGQQSGDWEVEERAQAAMPPEVPLSLLLLGFPQPQLEAAYQEYHALSQAPFDKLAALGTAALIPVTHMRCWNEGGVHITFLWGLALYTMSFTLPFWALLASGPAWRARYRAAWLLASQLLCYSFMALLLATWVPLPKWLSNVWSAPGVTLLNGGLFTPVTFQVPFRHALLMHLAHSLAVDTLAVAQLRGWTWGLLTGCLVALVSVAVSALLDWRCRIRFVAHRHRSAAGWCAAK